MIKLILIAYSFQGGITLTDVNIGDIRTPAGFYFSTMEKCEEVGNAWAGKGGPYTYQCLEMKS